MYTYDRTAAATKPKAQQKPAKEPPSRTDGVKKSEVNRAEKAIRAAIDAVLDCAPSSRDFHVADEDDYDSKAYNKAVLEHNKRVDALHDILEGILGLMPEAK